MAFFILTRFVLVNILTCFRQEAVAKYFLLGHGKVFPPWPRDLLPVLGITI